MRTIKIFLLVFVIPFSILAQKATLNGRVVDAVSNEPLPFVNVIVSGTSTGTTTDLDGNFQLTGLTPGFIRIEASFVGYKQTISPEIEVRSANTSSIEIKMEQQKEQIEEVVVKASPFRTTEESPLSLRTIGIGEVEKSPGANRDISKVIQSFPGVQSTPAYRNDVIIRGGGPTETRFYLDGVEVPFINHFATQGASGGPVGIINADFIREVNYYSGAFPSDRGNALSGVLEFNQVDGNSEKLNFQFAVGASEVAATVEGPAGDKTSLIVSARRSYLQFLFSALKLPFLPTFNDLQFKVKTRLNKKNELTFIGLGAYDINVLNTDIENPDPQQQSILDQLPENKQWSYSLGAVYKHYAQHGFHTVVASRSHFNNSAEKYLNNDYSNENNKILDYSSQEIENRLRYENTSRFGDYKLNAGVNLDFATYTNNTVQQRVAGDQIVSNNYNTDLNLVKWGLFGQVSKNFLSERLTLSLGFRTDANNYYSGMSNMFKQFSPRFSASYKLTPQFSLNFNTGRYYQLPSYTTLGYKENNAYVNKSNQIKYISADHFIAGVNYRPSSTVLFSLEGFLKKYGSYPWSVNDSISLANKGADFGVVGDEEILSISDGRAYGAEFQTRINSPKGFNFNLSYTLVRSEFGTGQDNYIPSSWDSKHLIALTTTKDLKKNWRVGGRWRFVGGLPYTPWDLEKSAYVEVWNLTGDPTPDYEKLNSLRFPAFNQLDVRVDKSFYLNKITAKFYIDVQNLLNFQAKQNDIVVPQKDANGNYVTIDNGTKYVLETYPNTSGTVLPTVGIILVF